MKVDIKNDGKEKYQSFTASTSDSFSDVMSYGDISLDAFGADADEARHNLLVAATNMKSQLESLIKELSGTEREPDTKQSDNPDLPASFIADAKEAIEQFKEGQVTHYARTTKQD